MKISNLLRRKHQSKYSLSVGVEDPTNPNNFIRVPVEIPLNTPTLFNLKLISSNEITLLNKLLIAAETLEQGEEKELNLSVRLRRSNDSDSLNKEVIDSFIKQLNI